MSDDPNPFTKPEAPKTSGPGGGRTAWIASAVLAALLIVVSILWWRDASSMRGELDQANTALTNSIAEDNQDKAQIAALQAQAADLQKEKDSVAQRAKGLEDEMRSDLESKDVTISKLQGKLTVNILDRVLFDSGEAVLKPKGQAVLREIATILAGHPELKIHVIGHTDNVPIHARFASNWELSTARALAAVHFLTEQAGVDPRRVGVVGYGEYRPIADNSTEEGRARNRRIAITILSDELAGADTASGATAPAALAPAPPPAGAPDAATNPPPPSSVPAGGD